MTGLLSIAVFANIYSSTSVTVVSGRNRLFDG